MQNGRIALTADGGVITISRFEPRFSVQIFSVGFCSLTGRQTVQAIGVAFGQTA
jgi:hypothetical protein